MIISILLVSACTASNTAVPEEETTGLPVVQAPTELPPPSPTSSLTNTQTSTAAPTSAVTVTQDGPWATEVVENSTTAQPAMLHAVKVAEDIPYHTALNEEVQEDKLDIYSPTEPGDWPVVVVFHGGASGGKGEEVATLSNRLAERGLVVLAPDIRSIRAEADEPAGMREYLEKVDCVVRFAHAHAEEYGGDPKNMVVFGQSAGGYGGFWVSLVGDKIEQLWDNYHGTQGDAERQAGCLADRIADQVDAFVGFGGAYAYFEVNLGPRVAIGLEAGELLEVLSPSNYFGENPELVIRFIDGERDLIVPEAAVKQHKAWIEELAEMGYDAKWMEMAGGHGLDERTFDPVVNVITEVARR